MSTARTRKFDTNTILATLGHQHRLRMMLMLAQGPELCVCELSNTIQAAQPNISRHLRVLKEAGLIRDRRAGKWVYYRMVDGLPSWIHQLIDALLEADAHATGSLLPGRRQQASRLSPSRSVSCHV